MEIIDSAHSIRQTSRPLNVSTLILAAIFIATCLPTLSQAEDSPALTLAESSAGSSDWAYRPEEGDVTAENPPGFCWRHQSGIVRWELRFTAIDTEKQHELTFEGVTLPTYRPSTTWRPGRYAWSYRGFNAKNESTNWSVQRRFTIPETATAMPMPSREVLLNRIPDAHPRLRPSAGLGVRRPSIRSS